VFREGLFEYRFYLALVNATTQGRIKWVRGPGQSCDREAP